MHICSNFAYNLAWTSDRTVGTAQSSRLSVGSASYTDNFMPTQFSSPSLGSAFSHSGTTAISKSPDGTFGYIPITINFGFSKVSDAKQYRWYMKALGLQITTPTVAVAPGSGGLTVAVSAPISGSRSISVTATANGTESSHLSGTVNAPSSWSGLLPPGLASQQGYSTVSSPDGNLAVGSNTSDSDRDNNSTSTAALVGGVVGGIALFGGLVVSFFLMLYWRKMKRRKWVQPNTGNGDDGDDDGWKYDLEPVLRRGGAGDSMNTLTTMTTTMSHHRPEGGKMAIAASPIVTAEQDVVMVDPLSSPLPIMSPPITDVPSLSSSLTVDSPNQSGRQDTQPLEPLRTQQRRRRREGGEGGGRRGRRARGQPVMDVPPPAYSTLGSTDDPHPHHRDHGGDENEEDQGEEGVVIPMSNHNTASQLGGSGGDGGGGVPVPNDKFRYG
ncbi:hypothetical protein FRC17_001891 [Serendipita sp. 399]|nr:hypothetical protein FRC17_001891 [Serendipita sp. 399]